MQEEKDYAQLSFPISQALHTKLKIITNARQTTIRKVAFSLIKEFIEREENQKILSGLK